MLCEILLSAENDNGYGYHQPVAIGELARRTGLTRKQLREQVKVEGLREDNGEILPPENKIDLGGRTLFRND